MNLEAELDTARQELVRRAREEDEHEKQTGYWTKKAERARARAAKLEAKRLEVDAAVRSVDTVVKSAVASMNRSIRLLRKLGDEAKDELQRLKAML
jgi:phosphatidate phosphatase APP1